MYSQYFLNYIATLNPLQGEGALIATLMVTYTFSMLSAKGISTLDSFCGESEGKMVLSAHIGLLASFALLINFCPAPHVYTPVMLTIGLALNLYALISLGLKKMGCHESLKIFLVSIITRYRGAQS